MSCDKSHLSLKPNWLVWAFSKISSGGFCIGRHKCHRHIYLLWIAFICTIFRHIIYFLWYISTRFSIICVLVNFLIQSVRFLTICNYMILRSEVHMCFLTVTFVMIIIRVVWIEGWFLMVLIRSLFLKEYFDWLWTSTVNALWFIKICYLIFLTELSKCK